MPSLKTFLPLVLLSSSVHGSTIQRSTIQSRDPGAKVLILGGGVAGVIAARTLHENGIDNFLIVEARDELGGRLMSTNFSGTVVELGANWVQGTQTGSGPANPIFTLAKKHDIKTQISNYFTSITTYDQTGQVEFVGVFNKSIDAYIDLTVSAGGRVPLGQVDLTSRAQYNMIGWKPQDAHARAAEYFQFDWEYAQTPAQTSAIASSWAQNFTFDPDQGGFSEDNLLSLDQRGFKALIQEEGNDFLKPEQIRLSSTVKTVSRSSTGVKVTLTDNTTIAGDYALCTFSLGVLQNDDVAFEPDFPSYKKEAIASMTMATYTKIFLRFPQKFWFDTEFALYADPERGRYPVWQSLDHPGFLPGSGLIFVTVTGDYSERIESLPDDQVKAEVLSVLKAMYPNMTIPDPIDFKFNRWYSDKLYRGSYSNWPPSFFKQHHDNLRANLGRLYFAGEHTSQKYFGFLHGAFFEGLNMGKRMIRCIKQGQCSTLAHTEEIKNAGSYGIQNVDD